MFQGRGELSWPPCARLVREVKSSKLCIGRAPFALVFALGLGCGGQGRSRDTRPVSEVSPLVGAEASLGSEAGAGSTERGPESDFFLVGQRIWECGEQIVRDDSWR